MSNRQIFEQLSTVMATGGPPQLLTVLAGHLESQARFHELFEVRKLQIRQQLSLPLATPAADETLPAEVQQRLEEGLIDACQEVGQSLLRAGRIRDGWHYLRAVGDRSLVQQELAALEPNEQNLDEFIELCVHEGLDVARGFQLLLEHYGTCNTITTYESAMYGRPRQQREIGAGLLVEHLYRELVANVKQHIARQESPCPADATLQQLLAGRPWLFEGGTYHIDTTHLASVVRLARDLEQPDQLQRMLELIEYAEQLDPTLQYPGDPPFEALYAASRRYVQALLQRDLAENLAYFRERAETANPREETTLTIETYVELLYRIGRYRDALQEALRLLPEDVHQTGRAPSLLELADAADDFSAVQQLTQRRDDPLGFAICLLRASAGQI